METINLPTSEAPAEIRESIRAVLHSHMFVVACEPSSGFAGFADGQPLLAALTPDRFEALLVELGNNAMQRMHMLAINAVLDQEELDAAREARKPPRVSLDDIKWSDAEQAAAALVKLCRDIGFVAPEGWQTNLHDAAKLMDDVAKALHLTEPVDKLSTLVRYYIEASDAFDASTMGDPQFKPLGIVASSAREALRKAVTP